MGLKKGIFRIIHPNKVKRPYQQLAERQKSAINLQAVTEQEAAKLRRDHNLTAVTDAYNKAKEEYNLAYHNELSQITGDHNQKHAEYLGLLNNLQQTKQQHIEQIVANFNRLKDQLLANQQLEQERLVACIEKVATLHSKCKNNYNNHKLLLDNLWHQITTNILHQDCITGYDQLKQFDNLYFVKVKYYSLLVGYFKQLAAQNIISNADFDRYKKFLYTVCNTNNKLEQNIDFCAIDREITEVLVNITHQEQEILSFAHQQDHHNNQVSYNKSIEFDNILHHKFKETKQEILNKYSPALLNLADERDQKHQVLEDNYATIKNQVDAEWNNHQNTHNAYINNLNDNKTTIERELDNQEQQEKVKINENYQTELQSIATSVKNILEKIDNDLNAQLKQLKHAARASIVNLFTSITTAVAAYFSGGLLSGVSGYIENSVQLSLTATSLGALENLVKDREKFGFTTIINFPRDQPIQDFKPEERRNVATQNQQGSDFSANLAKLKEEFSIFNQQVHTWQTQAEHDLFYSLNQSIFVRPNFSNALAVYSSQTYKFNFGIEAELGGLQANGFRNIKWNINLDNNQWYGNYLMRDRDIRNIIHKITNNSSVLNNNWQQPQRLRFNNNSSFSTKVIANPSWTNSILNFPGNLLFGQMAYADGLPTYSYNLLPSGVNSYLDVSFGEKLLILTGGGMKHVWSGFKQGSYMAGERLGILAPGTVANYTNRRNQEMQLYNSTPVGQSELRPWVEFGTEMLLYSAIPVAGYGRMGLIVNSALSGGVIGGLQFVEDGQISSRFINSGAGATLGVGVGVVAHKVGGSLLKLYDARQAQQFHVSSSKPRVDTSRLSNTSSSLPSSSSSSTSTPLSRETQRLLGKADSRYKPELFERAGKTKNQTTLNAAKIELQGGQIDLAIERGVSFDHVSKVKAAQEGLLRHLGKINARLSHPELPMIEREALNAELSKASKLLDHTKQVSSPNLRVDTPKLPSSSSSIPTASSSTSTQISRETKRLIGKTDRYKSELFERAGKTKDQTTLNAAKIELQGKQIDLAIEKGVVFDHMTKVEAAQNGLLKHLKDINARLSHPECSMVERNALETELSKASKLLDHTEQFVPRTSTPQPPNYPKPRAT